jgi:hypothetical protein
MPDCVWLKAGPVAPRTAKENKVHGGSSNTVNALKLSVGCRFSYLNKNRSLNATVCILKHGTCPHSLHRLRIQVAPRICDNCYDLLTHFQRARGEGACKQPTLKCNWMIPGNECLLPEETLYATRKRMQVDLEDVEEGIALQRRCSSEVIVRFEIITSL